jgi:hypothetical protein
MRNTEEEHTGDEKQRGKLSPVVHGESGRVEEWGSGGENWGKRSVRSRGLATRKESKSVGWWQWLAGSECRVVAHLGIREKWKKGKEASAMRSFYSRWGWSGWWQARPPIGVDGLPASQSGATIGAHRRACTSPVLAPLMSGAGTGFKCHAGRYLPTGCTVYRPSPLNLISQYSKL